MIVYPKDNKDLYYRLIALWVVCEAFAGGIMHAAKIPFAGMVVSGFAVTCIIFIAYYLPSKTNILKATIIVAIFKLMLSPYAPPTAYIAVFFQGLLGQLLFRNQRFFRLSALILSVLALTESAVQRLLVLLIVYGKSFWKAADEYLNKLLGSDHKNYSFLLAGIYILIHAIAGVIIGIYAVRLAKNAESRVADQPELLIPEQVQEPVITGAPVKRKKIKWMFIMIWLALIAIFIHAYADPKHAILPSGETGKILLRSALIVLSWYLVIAPLIMRFIRAKMNALKEKQHLPIKEIMDMLPRIKNIFMQSWALSASLKGLERLKLFLKIASVNILAGR
jgi:hypothetical protein